LYIFYSFVKDKMSIGAWTCLCGFCFVELSISDPQLIESMDT